MANDVDLTIDFKEVEQKVNQIDDRLSRDLEAIAEAALKPVLDDARAHVHRESGDLAASLRIETISKSTHHVESAVTANTPYARREEMGFSGTDSLGRVINFPGHPYLRPAHDRNRDAMRREATSELQKRIR